MPAALDITGQKYGRLTALSLSGKNSLGERLWSFLCDCGTEVVLRLGQVRNGKTRSCGCLRKETTAQTRFRDFSNLKIGRLTVLGLSNERHSGNRIAWSCQCSCGAIVTLPSSVLGRKNPTSSCGCWQKEVAAAMRRAEKQLNPVSKTPEYRAEIKRRRRSRPEVAVAESVSRMLCLALQSVNAVKKGRTFQMLGYTPSDLKSHLERQFKPGMTWENRGKWEIDHIVPISSARSVEDVISLNQLSNLRPLWAKENNSKKDKRLFLI